MKLRTQLILAFLALSVIPLLGVVLYSYNSSSKAVMQAVEEESAAMAQDMGSRMEAVSSDLRRRIERLGDIPFQSMMTAAGTHRHEDMHPVWGQLMNRMGDSAGFLNSIEFVPAVPGDAKDVRIRGPKRMARPLPALPPGRLVLHLADEKAGTAEAMRIDEDGNRVVMTIPPPPPPPPPLPDERGVRELAERLRRETESLTLSPDTRRQILELKKRALRVSRKEVEMVRRDVDLDIWKNGAIVGKLRAQVSSFEILRHVLRRTQRKSGEIPFAVDSKGNLIAADPEDMERLLTLPLPGRKGGSETEGSRSNHWVVVTRDDKPSGMTFGIARPVTDRLGEIRRTAVRNLGYGLAMVALALVGIVPLSSRMTRNVTALTRGAEQLAGGDLQTRVAVRSKDEIGQLAAAFNRMAHQLSENQKRLLEQERIRKELEMCRKIQEELLPPKSFQSGVVEVRGVSIPARDVGGDFFNYFPLSEGKIALLIGDVSGKGLPAALLMANLQATIQARLPLEPDLAALARKLDAEIEANTPPELYLTLFMAVLETDSGVLRYVNAGHNTQFALHDDGSVDPLASTGRPLGLLPGGEYVEDRLVLRAKDSLFLYTDGLVEAENHSGEEFGMDRLEQVLISHRSKGPDGFLAHMEEELHKHRDGVEAGDDATMVLVRVGLTPAVSAS